MSRDPFALQPIPDRCPVPPNIVAYIGGIIDEKKPTFALWRNKEQIIIEAKGEMDCAKGLDADDPYYHWKLDCAVRKRYMDILEVIGLLQNIDFKSTNWGYLLKDLRSGQYHITQKNRTLYRLHSAPWATFIPEREIEFTVWGTCSDRRGIWKGKKVDIMYAWCDIEIWALEKAMAGARALQGHDLDLTYEVYGHLVDDDDRSIIGLVTEAALGRMIGPSDMRLVYSAIAKLQSRGFLYRGCGTNRFMIQDNKVRLTELNCIEHYTDRRKLEKDAEQWHWAELQKLFEEFRIYGRYGDHRIPHSRFTASWKDIELIYPTPSPELPLGGILLHCTFFRAFEATYWPGHRREALWRKNHQSDTTLISDEHDSPFICPPNSIPRTRYSQITSSIRTERRYYTPERARGPLNPSTHPRNRPLLASSSHPYTRRAARPRKALTTSSDTQSSSSHLDAATTLSFSFHPAETSSDSITPRRFSPHLDSVEIFFRDAKAMSDACQITFFPEELARD